MYSKLEKPYQPPRLFAMRPKSIYMRFGIIQKVGKTIQHLQSEDQYTGKLRVGRRQVSLSKAAK